MAKKPTLTARQTRFAQLWAQGPPGVRGNGIQAYRRAGYNPSTDASAEVGASRLLNTAMVRQEIVRLNKEADAQVIQTLVDWKTYAPEAQNRIRAIALGFIPDSTVPETRMRQIRTRDDAAVASVLLRAATTIIERAYPMQFYSAWQKKQGRNGETLEMLASIIGVAPEQLPARSSSHLQELLSHGDTLSNSTAESG